MKRLGYLLLIAGFLSGAYATALDVQATNWALFIPSAVLAATGLLIAKRAERGQATAVEVLTANRGDLETSLVAIVDGLDELIRRGDRINVDDLRGEIDERLREALRRFADARESMVHLYSLQTYADIMSEFAAGERGQGQLHLDQNIARIVIGRTTELLDRIRGRVPQLGSATLRCVERVLGKRSAESDGDIDSLVRTQILPLEHALAMRFGQ